MFIGKRDYFIWLDNPDVPYLNKLMIESFPFLMPRNRWTDRIPENFDYTHNEMYSMPYGWARAFGFEMLCELERALREEGILDQYRIMDIKEKYGTLRWYDNCASKRVFNIINKYCAMSIDVCIYCGAKSYYETPGWISYICKKCARKEIKKGLYKRKHLTKIKDLKKEYENEDDDL